MENHEGRVHRTLPCVANWVPPGRLERPLLASEANALSTELRGLARILYHGGGEGDMAASLPMAGLLALLRWG